jgi:osmotically-inducible protein OsmY
MAGRWSDEWRDRDWRAESDWRDDDRQRWSGSEERSFGREDRVFGERDTGVGYNRPQSEFTRGRYGGSRPDDDWVTGGASSGAGRYGAGSNRYGSESGRYGAESGRYGSESGRSDWQDRNYGGVSPAMRRGDYDTGYRSNPRFEDRAYGHAERDYRSMSGSYDEGRRFGTREADQRWAREMRRPVSGGTGGYDYDERGYGDGGRFTRERDFEDRARDAGDFFRRTGERVKSWFQDVTGDDDRGYYEARGHRGIGPKGYKRSDDRISDDAHQRLTDDAWLDASNVNVSVSGGEITLSGTVENREAKHRAERIVEDISGVNHVQNNLRIQPGGYFTSAGRGFGDSVQEAQMRRSDPLKEVTDGEADKPQMLQQAGGNGTMSTDDSAATRSPTRRT